MWPNPHRGKNQRRRAAHRQQRILFMRNYTRSLAPTTKLYVLLKYTRQHKQRRQLTRLYKLFQLSSNNIHDNINNGDNKQSCTSCSGCRLIIYTTTITTETTSGNRIRLSSNACVISLMRHMKPVLMAWEQKMSHSCMP